MLLLYELAQRTFAPTHRTATCAEIDLGILCADFSPPIKTQSWKLKRKNFMD